ncbi:MAG: PilW family protein [Candidatus Xenobia bacterium]
MRHRRGLSLVELLVATGVGSLLLSAALVAFVSAGRLLQWSGVHTEVGSSCILALRGLGREVRESSWANLTINASPAFQLAFRMQDGDTKDLSSYTPANQFITYYYDGQNTLVRKTWDGGNPSLTGPDPFATGRLTNDQLAQLVTTKNGTEHVVVRNVVAVSVTPTVFPTVTGVDGIAIWVRVEKPINDEQSVQQVVTTTVYPRNHP